MGISTYIYIMITFIVPPYQDGTYPTDHGNNRSQWIDQDPKFCAPVDFLAKVVPGLANVYRTNWKDPPFYSWVNPL